jgi:hypothetical protein
METRGLAAEEVVFKMWELEGKLQWKRECTSDDVTVN